MVDYIESDVDLSEYPTPQKDINVVRAQFYLGDLHGNALKLFYCLIHWGILEVTENDYLRFVLIYTGLDNPSSDEEIAGHIKQFNELLSRCKVNNRATLYLIGDDLADRGVNDYLTLKILEKLSKDEQRIQIVMSNHGLSFLQAHEKVMMGAKGADYSPVMLEGRHSVSLINLKRLIEKNLISIEEIKDTVQQHYLPHLKLLTYTVDDEEENTITIVSHASIDFNIIKLISEKLNINDYDDSSILALTRSIDKINAEVARYIAEGRLSEIINEQAIRDYYRGEPVSFTDYPIEACLWNREYSGLDRKPQIEGEEPYAVNYIHGHDKDEANRPRHIICLDSDWAKRLKLKEEHASWAYLPSGYTPEMWQDVTKKEKVVKKPSGSSYGVAQSALGQGGSSGESSSQTFPKSSGTHPLEEGYRSKNEGDFGLPSGSSTNSSSRGKKEEDLSLYSDFATVDEMKNNPLWKMHCHFTRFHFLKGHRAAFLVDFSRLYNAMEDGLGRGENLSTIVKTLQAPQKSNGTPIEFKGDYGIYRKELAKIQREELTDHFQQYKNWVDKNRHLLTSNSPKKHTDGEVLAAISAPDCAKKLGYTVTKFYHR